MLEKNKISKERACIIINNLLSQIVDYTDISKEQYIPWLKQEVGLSDTEIKELRDMNCFPEM